MRGGKSLLAVIILENIEHRCKFDLCIEHHSFEEIEKHVIIEQWLVQRSPVEQKFLFVN